MTPAELTALVLYVATVAVDGDFMNDWLTHLPWWAAGATQLAGAVLASLLGS